MILTAHAGWSGERSRGSSGLEDWADSIIYLTGDISADDDSRFIRALGRDVQLDEDKLRYDHTTRSLTLTGSGSRRSAVRTAKAASLVDTVCTYLNGHPGASQTDIIKGVRASHRRGNREGFQDQDVREAVKLAEKRGMLRLERHGSGRATLHYPVTPTDQGLGESVTHDNASTAEGEGGRMT